MNDEDRDALLARLDERTGNIARDVHELKLGMYGTDGQGGICGEVSKLKSQQMKWLGRDGAIVAGISAIFTAAGLLIQMKGGS